MTITATSLAAALWDRYGRTDAIRRSSRKDAQQMLLICFCIDNVLSRWTPRHLTDVLKGTLFPPMFAHSLSTDSRQDAGCDRDRSKYLAVAGCDRVLSKYLAVAVCDRDLSKYLAVAVCDRDLSKYLAVAGCDRDLSKYLAVAVCDRVLSKYLAVAGCDVSLSK